MSESKVPESEDEEPEPDSTNAEFNVQSQEQPAASTSGTGLQLRKKNSTKTLIADNTDDDFSTSEDEYIPPKATSSDDDDDDLPNQRGKKRCSLKNKRSPPKKRKVQKKCPWTPRSSKYKEHRFNTYIYGKSLVLPGKTLLEEVQMSTEAPSPLKRRSWKHLKDFVRNRATSYRKKNREIGFNHEG